LSLFLELLMALIQDILIQKQLTVQQNLAFNRRKFAYTYLHKELELLLNILQILNKKKMEFETINLITIFNQYLAKEIDNNNYWVRFFF
jgi:hypothetical protein